MLGLKWGACAGCHTLACSLGSLAHQTARSTCKRESMGVNPGMLGSIDLSAIMHNHLSHGASRASQQRCSVPIGSLQGQTCSMQIEQRLDSKSTGHVPWAMQQPQRSSGQAAEQRSLCRGDSPGPSPPYAAIAARVTAIQGPAVVQMQRCFKGSCRVLGPGQQGLAPAHAHVVVQLTCRRPDQACL